MSKDELRKDVKQLQEVVLNVANMQAELREEYTKELAWIKSINYSYHTKSCSWIPFISNEIQRI